MGRLGLTSLALFIASCSATNPFLASTLGSNMVLQRGKNSTIYGWASSPNASITCTLDGKEYQTKASPNGTADDTFMWACTFPVYEGGFDTHNINISSPSTGQSAYLENVLFGDVFFCGGQSNMEFAMPAMSDADTEIPDADNYPYIRLFSVGQDETSPNSEIPLDDLWSVSLPWSIASSDVMQDADGDAFGYFSAVCYETGKNIFINLLNKEIPVGLVSSNWGGTQIETWMPETYSQACGDSMIASKDFKNPDLVKDTDDGATDFTTTPAINYNNMIVPFKDMDFTAVLWYQGESNTGYNTNIYPCLQVNMMDAWHTLGEGWNDIPILFVQLAPWEDNGDSSIADMRWAQYTIVLQDDHHYIVSAADLGDPESPEGNIHPRYKSEVGRRLSLAASTAIYGKTVPHMGPMPLTGDALDDGSFGAYLKFEESTIGDGLSLKDAQECPDSTYCGYHYLVYPSAGSVLVDNDTLEIDGNTIKMYPTDAQTEKPIGISYGYKDYPMLTIYNSYDLPLMPFATDLPFVL